MHTLQKNSHHNKRLIEFCLQKAYPDGIITIDRLIADNLINGTQVAELAVCRTNGFLDIHPIGIGQDLTDGSDVKTITVQDEKSKTWIVKNGKRTGEFLDRTLRRACVNEIKNKIGDLRVICYNPFNDEWKFFIIPNDVFKGMKKISISFDKQTHQPNGLYAKFEVPSWLDLCKNKGEI
jgi:hypothetical protein